MGGILALKDLDGVDAAVRAFAASEHGAAEAVVVLEGGGALRIRGADPLRGGARHHRVRVGGDRHLRGARRDVGLGRFAEVVAGAVALEKNKKKRKRSTLV